jgi:hypothetical protein
VSFCFDCAKASNTELEETLQQAKIYAQEQQKPVAVFKEDNAYSYGLAQYAIESRQLIVQIVSVYS